MDKPAGAEGLRHVDMGHGRCRRLAAGAPFQVLQEAPGQRGSRPHCNWQSDGAAGREALRASRCGGWALGSRSEGQRHRLIPTICRLVLSVARG